MRIVSITIFLIGFIVARPGGAFPTSSLDASTPYVPSDDTTGFVVTETDWAPRTYVGKRDTVSFADITQFFTDHIGRIYGDAHSKGVSLGGPPSGLYWHWDMEKMRTVMAAAIAVDGSTLAFDDYDVFEIPAGKALVTEYVGPYEQMMSAHEAIDAHIMKHEMGAPTVVLEEYMTDPGTEPDPSKWQTRITYVFAE